MNGHQNNPAYDNYFQDDEQLQQLRQKAPMMLGQQPQMNLCYPGSPDLICRQQEAELIRRELGGVDRVANPAIERTLFNLDNRIGL